MIIYDNESAITAVSNTSSFILDQKASLGSVEKLEEKHENTLDKLLLSECEASEDELHLQSYIKLT